MKMMSALTAAFLGATSLAAGDTAPPLVIGVAGPMMTTYGEDMRIGVDYAVARINRQGGINGRPVRIEYVDDENIGAKAVDTARKLMSDGVRIVFGHYRSDATVAAESVYKEYGALVLTVSQSDAVVKQGLDIVRVTANAGQLSRGMKDFVLAQPGWTVAIIYQSDDAGADVAKRLRDDLAAAGRTVLPVPYHGDVTDFSAIATKVIAARADLAVVPGSADKIGRIARAFQDQGSRLKLVGPGTASLPEAGRTAQCPAASNILAIATAIDNTQLEGEERDFRDLALFSDMAMQVIATAADKAHSTDPAALRQAIGQGVATRFGPFSILPNGDRDASVVTYKWDCATGGPQLKLY